MIVDTNFQKQYQYFLLSMFYIGAYNKHYVKSSKIDCLIECDVLLNEALDSDDTKFVANVFEILCILHLAGMKDSLSRFFKTGGNAQKFITSDWIPTGIELSGNLEFNRQAVISCVRDGMTCLAYHNLYEVTNPILFSNSRERYLDKSTYSNEIRLSVIEALGRLSTFLMDKNYVETYIYTKDNYS